MLLPPYIRGDKPCGLIDNVFQHPKEKTEKSVNLFGEIIPGFSALGMDKYILRDLLKRIGVRVQAIATAGSSVSVLEQPPGTVYPLKTP